VTPSPPTAPSTPPPATPHPIALTTAAMLQDAAVQPIRTVVPGLVPEGLCLLVGRPKFGKSWLALDLCIAIASGRPALGALQSTTGDVLYLALEDGFRRLHRRMATLLPAGERWPARLGLTNQWRCAHDGGIGDIRAWCRAVAQPVLVVIDTLERFRARRGHRRRADDTLAELQRLALEQHIAIVVVHHARKRGARDPFDTVAGARGLSGAADTLLVLRQRDRACMLHVRGRDLEDCQWPLTFDSAQGRWTLGAPMADAAKSQARAAVMALLARGPLAVKDIMAATGRPRRATDSLLHRMRGDQEIVRVTKGCYARQCAKSER
jgi:AAA domain